MRAELTHREAALGEGGAASVWAAVQSEGTGAGGVGPSPSRLLGPSLPLIGRVVPSKAPTAGLRPHPRRREGGGYRGRRPSGVCGAPITAPAGKVPADLCPLPSAAEGGPRPLCPPGRDPRLPLHTPPAPPVGASGGFLGRPLLFARRASG